MVVPFGSHRAIGLMCEADGTSDQVLSKSKEGQCPVPEDGKGG